MENLDEKQRETGYKLWPLAKVRPNPKQPRKTDSKDATYKAEMKALKDSIKAIGQLVPILVTQPNSQGRSMIIDGERRWTALKELNSEKSIDDNPGTIKVIFEVVEDDNDLECFLLSFGANCCRLDMSPVDIAEGIKKLQNTGYSVEQIAQISGKSIHWVYNMLKYLKLDPAMAEKLNAGEINPQIAMSLTSFKTDEQQKILSDVSKAVKTKGKALTQSQLSLAVAQSAKKRNIKPEKSKKGKRQMSFELKLMKQSRSEAKNLNELLVQVAELTPHEIKTAGGEELILLDQELAKLEKSLKAARRKLDKEM